MTNNSFYRRRKLITASSLQQFYFKQKCKSLVGKKLTKITRVVNDNGVRETEI